MPPPGREFSCPQAFAALEIPPAWLQRTALARETRASATPGLKAALGLHGALGAAGGALLLADRQRRAEQERLAQKEAAKTKMDKELEKAARAAHPLPTREKLIEQAQEALRKSRAGGKLDLELGKFFLEGELVDNPGRQGEEVADDFALHEEVLKGAREIGQSTAAPFERIKSLALKLAPFTENYCRSLTLLDDFYRSGCGNCVANTKLLTAALLDGKIPLPDGYELGAQLFHDHVQAVLLDRKNHRVFDLLTGDTTNQIEAPVYRPEMLLTAYLKKKKADTILKPQELLLAPMDPGFARAGLVATEEPDRDYNSNLEFDGPTGGDFTKGKVPKFARQRAFGEAKGSGGYRGRGNCNPAKDRCVPGQAELAMARPRIADAMDREKYEADLGLFGMAFPGNEFPDSETFYIAFDTPELLRQFQSLRSDEEAEEFVRGQMQMGLAKTLGAPGLRKLRAVLGNPQSITELSPAEKREIWNAVDALKAYENFRPRFLTGNAPPELERAPLFRKIKADVDSFRQSVERHPIQWLHSIDSWPSATTTAFLEFLASRPWHAGFINNPKREPLFHGNPLQPVIDRALKSPEVDYSRPASFGQDIQWDTMLELDGPNKGAFYVRGDAEKKEANAKEAEKGGQKDKFQPIRPKATQIIHPHTMAGLILNNFGPEGNTLWSSVLGDAYQVFYQKPAFQAKLIYNFLTDKKFPNTFREAATRSRFRDSSFVSLKIRKNSDPPEKNLLEIPFGDLFPINMGKGLYDQKIFPREIAEALQGAIQKRYGGAFTVELTPSAPEDVKALMNGTLLDGPAPPLRTGTSFGTSLEISNPPPEMNKQRIR